MQIYVKIAAFYGFLGVSAGAFGAHALKQKLENRTMTHVWETAVLYTLIHAVAILAIGLHSAGPGVSLNPWLKRACFAWSLGVTLFAGSLYGLALGGPRFLGPITPLGGLFLIAGWVGVFLAATRSPATKSP
jgi:uncharacterized membrane protein YgdD (TMEM256/DUF423 family)